MHGEGAMATVEEEIRQRLARLSPEQRKDVLKYVRRLTGEEPMGLTPEEMEPFVGIWSPEAAAEVWRVIEEDCRRVDPNAW
jgi:hypothetical protein